MSEFIRPYTNTNTLDRRGFLRLAGGFCGLIVLSACGGEPNTDPESAPAQSAAPALTPEVRGTAWDVDCTAQVPVENNDVFADVITRAQEQCPELSIHDAYESMKIQDRSVNEIYAGETLTLKDYKNVP